MAGPARLLVVDDDEALLDVLERDLVEDGFAVHTEADGAGAEAALTHFRPDLALLDIRLPPPDGFALARIIRDRVEIPVVFLTARDGLDDRLAGFAAGADDYVVKPVALAELRARVRAVLRRSGRLRSATHRVQDLVVDEVHRVVLRAGRRIRLTDTELDLLVALVRHPGRVLSKQELLERVWRFDGFHPNLVEVHVSALRRKLEAYGNRLIHTRHGAGYVLGRSRPSGPRAAPGADAGRDGDAACPDPAEPPSGPPLP